MVPRTAKAITISTSVNPARRRLGRWIDSWSLDWRECDNIIVFISRRHAGACTRSTCREGTASAQAEPDDSDALAPEGTARSHSQSRPSRPDPGHGNVHTGALQGLDQGNGRPLPQGGADPGLRDPDAHRAFHDKGNPDKPDRFQLQRVLTRPLR